jgi:uncharacterized membrane protein
VVCRLDVRADLWLTTPAGLIQPATGFWMVRLAGWPLETPWLLTALLLYLLAGACWLPVVWLQWRMAQMATAAVSERGELPPLYERYAARWERLGYPAFLAMLIVFYLMVSKPALWGNG